MNAKEVISEVSEKIEKTANVKAIFGQPEKQGSIKIIPVAKTKVSGGGGGGSGKGGSSSNTQDEGQGMGLGLNVTTTPVGYIKISREQAEFVPIIDRSKIIVGGMIVGGLIALTTLKLVARASRRKK